MDPPPGAWSPDKVGDGVSQTLRQVVDDRVDRIAFWKSCRRIWRTGGHVVLGADNRVQDVSAVRGEPLTARLHGSRRRGAEPTSGGGPYLPVIDTNPAPKSAVLWPGRQLGGRSRRRGLRIVRNSGRAGSRRRRRPRCVSIL